MKFKVGDKVVHTARHLKTIGKTNTIIEIPLTIAGDIYYHLVKLDSGVSMHIENITLEEIYNSPLYQLMKEES